jgi:short-subunit dehydrogenase involved in D-alanine esterification of teichoic acids
LNLYYEYVCSLQKGHPFRRYLWYNSFATIAVDILGIGLALAEKYAETGTHVVAVGRRQKQLDELASKHKGMVSTKIFDIAQLDKIPAFVEEVTAEHPDLGCVFLNR